MLQKEFSEIAALISRLNWFEEDFDDETLRLTLISRKQDFSVTITR